MCEHTMNELGQANIKLQVILIYFYAYNKLMTLYIVGSLANNIKFI
jgi:hypothetical protein